jgi:phospholipid/cholesterol/gamma-HCH transport system ATP-binding protein
MIEIHNIHKSFDGVKVLDGVSGVFETGKTNLLLGASGTGKSVLLKCIVGLIKPDLGSVTFDGTYFTNNKLDIRQEIRRKIGMLFQSSALFDSMTVEKNVEFPLKMLTDMSKEERMERVNFCLKRVGLEGSNKKMPSELSGGMKKRVGIARAIAPHCTYLFCDEPNSGLDPQTAMKIDMLIKEITEEYNITTIIVTHDMNSVIEIGDKIMFLYEGKKLWEGTRDEIMDTDIPELNDFIFANRLMRDAKKVEDEEEREEEEERLHNGQQASQGQKKAPSEETVETQDEPQPENPEGPAATTQSGKGKA